jgi:hypothetical protein
VKVSKIKNSAYYISAIDQRARFMGMPGFYPGLTATELSAGDTASYTN